MTIWNRVLAGIIKVRKSHLRGSLLNSIGLDRHIQVEDDMETPRGQPCEDRARDLCYVAMNQGPGATRSWKTQEGSYPKATKRTWSGRPLHFRPLASRTVRE